MAHNGFIIIQVFHQINTERSAGSYFSVLRNLCKADLGHFTSAYFLIFPDASCKIMLSNRSIFIRSNYEITHFKKCKGYTHLWYSGHNILAFPCDIFTWLNACRILLTIPCSRYDIIRYHHINRYRYAHTYQKIGIMHSKQSQHGKPRTISNKRSGLSFLFRRAKKNEGFSSFDGFILPHFCRKIKSCICSQRGVVSIRHH